MFGCFGRSKKKDKKKKAGKEPDKYEEPTKKPQQAPSERKEDEGSSERSHRYHVEYHVDGKNDHKIRKVLKDDTSSRSSTHSSDEISKDLNGAPPLWKIAGRNQDNNANLCKMGIPTTAGRQGQDKSRIGQDDVKQTSQVTHELKKKKPHKPKHRHYHNQESSDSDSDSSSDSTCDESTSADDSNDSPAVETTNRSQTKKKSKSMIINAPGGIIDFGKNNKNKIVHISYPEQKQTKTKDKDRSSRSHIKDAKPHMDQEQTEADFPGNFHKICDETDTISNMEMIVEVAKSVGIIRSPLVQGTGFRVGESYIMTALHVVEGIINPVLQPLNHREGETYLKLLGDRKVHIDFDYKLPVDALPQGQVVQGNTLRFNFEPEIFYQNKALDTAVLKLKHSSSNFPCQLTRFSHCLKSLPMYFIGHSNNQVKKFDKTNPRDLTESKIMQYQIWSQQHQIGCRENYRGYYGAADPKKILFDCSAAFNKGASGSPGFIISSHDKMPYVVSMLLRGYPDWYHDEEVKEKKCIPREYTFEQGVHITEVYKDMKANNPRLCSEIFGTC